MNTETKTYAHQSLAACGFAVMSGQVAWTLRPDLWGSDRACGSSLQTGMTVAGTRAMVADLAGLGRVRVLTRSTDMLAKRIEWVTGFAVNSLAEEDAAPAPAGASFQQLAAQRRHDEHQAELRQLAQQEPPTHDCHHRREVLRARAELKQQGVKWRRAA